MLVVSNQQESKVPHGVRTFANQSTIHGETGSMKFNLKIVAATAAVAMMSAGAAQAAATIDVVAGGFLHVFEGRSDPRGHDALSLCPTSWSPSATT